MTRGPVSGSVALMGKRWMVVPLALAACGEVNATDPDATTVADGTTLDAAPDADPGLWPDAGPMLGDWGTPTRLDGISEPVRHELSPTVTADGLELWFFRMDSAQRITLWRSVRAATSDAWGTPVEYPRGNLLSPQIEISPDGLEMFTRGNGGIMLSMRRLTRDAAWPTSAGQPGEIFRETLGGLPTLGDDGLTIYYSGSGVTAPLVKRQRANLAASWGEPTPAELEYPRPPRAENEIAERYGTFDLRGDTVLLSSPSFGSVLPAVSQLTRLQTGVWDAFRSVPAPSAASVLDCEIATHTEAICVLTVDGSKDLVRITREVAP